MKEETPASHSTRVMTMLFAASAVFATASFVMGFASRRVQPQGVLLGLSLLCLGIGLVLWANRVLTGGPYEEERESLTPTSDESAAMEEDLERGEGLTRRVWLRRSAIAAGGALSLGLVEPLRTFGPTPGRAPLRTSWRNGARLVTPQGDLVHADNIDLDALLTVFPEHHTDEANAQVVLMRVDPKKLSLPPERADWAPRGLLAFSKVCTHAGCPVGLYQSDIHQLLCPCHQSSFDVLDGAKPVSGPAAWALPQLPLAVNENGEVNASGPLSAPVGPGWWKQ